MATKTRSHKTSKGERRSIASGAFARSFVDHALDLHTAWKKGQNPWLTVSTPEKNKPFIRVRANDHWGDFRRRMTTPSAVTGEE